VGIGHSRLAIIDIDGGRQPMSNEDGCVWLTFNGEIYNYRELRAELRALGHSFKTSSDSEVVIHAYEQWRDNCVDHLRGMFAFGIVDTSRRRVFLARDHLGIKPLLVYASDGAVAFASEMQGLLQIPGFDRTLDVRALDQYLRLGYIPAPRTCYQHVKKLPPGHRLSVSFDTGAGSFERYWYLELKTPGAKHRRDLEEQLDAVLRESIRSHLVADVPYGALLSGGIDSSAVVAYMVEALGKPFPVFTIGFEDADFSEVEHAQVAARRWGLEHHVEVVKPDAVATLPLLVRHYGEPFADSSAIPTYFVSRLARGSVPMVLSGDGGDEFFLGYENYSRWLWWLSFDGAAPIKNLLRPLARLVRPVRFPRREPSLANWLDFVSVMPTSLRLSLWRAPYRQMAHLEVEAFESAYQVSASPEPATTAAQLDRLTYLPNDILTKVDVASMAHGLEVRTPLVDIAVAHFAASLPQAANMERRRDRRWEGKRLLKSLLRRYLPDGHIDRPKQGFSVPINRWFKIGTPLRRSLEDRIRDPQSSLHDFFEADALRAITESNRGDRMWQLLVLEEWFRQNTGWTLPARTAELMGFA
jgi:asparagine synthase (glutamine-hydrolysing)